MRTLHWKMNLRRGKSNLLTALLVALSAAFLMIYPGFIAGAEAELDAAYDQIEVTGWLINAAGYDDPMIPPQTCDAIRETGMIGRWSAYSYVHFNLPDEAIEKLAEDPGYEDMSREELLAALELRLSDIGLGTADVLFGVSGADAEVTLQRLKGSIVWLEGYSLADLAGDEAICVLPEESGLALGEESALILRVLNEDSFTERGEPRMIARFKVVGLYGIPMGGNFTDAAVAYCPLEAMRQTPGADERFQFAIRSFSFALRDSHDVSALKEALIGLALDRNETVRAAIDDRILQGTVAPIEKNIALLYGVQTLLYALVTGAGFLMCFLFTRARKPEFAVMRMLGQSPLSLMLGALAEQAALCALGLGIGTPLALLVSGGPSTTDWRIPALIAACYLAGAATAALLGAHGKPLTLLRRRE